MKHILIIAAVFALFFAPNRADAKVKIVSTLGDLAAVSSAVGGPDADVTLLANAHEDPHFVDAKPSFVKHLSAADLLVYNGMSLEVGWLPTLTKGSRNAKIQAGADGSFDASHYVQTKGAATGKISRAGGDVHPEGNPHYSVDPRQMARVAVALGKRLAKIDPDNAAAYQSRARAFAKEALSSAKKWEAKFAKLPQQCRDIVVYHEAWAYLTDWLKLDVAIAVEPKPGVPPNPRHVAKVFKTIQSQKINAIVHMKYYPNSATKTIAQKTGAKLIGIQGQTDEGASYFKRIDTMAGDLYSALQGGCK
ncbi:metal ABC transporter substrate-binding protein [Bradymonas sediminis]|uniref:Zinc ABC transporter substrate-binding protein n=1 Tax=Bradymonas sediminis TaxID=1548548 RepID=A0A2Z4FNP2_9DELT|nr:metal ABC transporter substrate-binding protein [Bradymonas sediminis]AWV90651.1 zinc ABC transporter substrate-binding protein [Bradymonas sediminis]TDP62346.1 zinc/manganese transport system substrate-binding protein [Bradymonas sediminis]